MYLTKGLEILVRPRGFGNGSTSHHEYILRDNESGAEIDLTKHLSKIDFTEGALSLSNCTLVLFGLKLPTSTRGV